MHKLFICSKADYFDSVGVFSGHTFWNEVEPGSDTILVAVKFPDPGSEMMFRSKASVSRLTDRKTKKVKPEVKSKLQALNVQDNDDDDDIAEKLYQKTGNPLLRVFND